MARTEPVTWPEMVADPVGGGMRILGNQIEDRNEKIRDMQKLLVLAKEKLSLYRAAHGGEYVGGMEYTDLIQRIDAALR